jgi:hypothetical protein
MAGNDNWDLAWLKWFEEDSLQGPRTLCAQSPCGARVVVSGTGLEPTLLLMHLNGFRDAVRDILVTGTGLDDVDVRCLADFYAGYDLPDLLAEILGYSPFACQNLSELFPAGMEILDTNVGRTERGDRLVRVGDMARSALAAHAAREVLESM